MRQAKTWRERVNRMVKRRRAALIGALGGRCGRCGGTRKLELHHVAGRTWVASHVGRHQSIKLYEADAAKGLLVLLCVMCHRLEVVVERGCGDSAAAGAAN